MCSRRRKHCNTYIHTHSKSSNARIAHIHLYAQAQRIATHCNTCNMYIYIFDILECSKCIHTFIRTHTMYWNTLQHMEHVHIHIQHPWMLESHTYVYTHKHNTLQHTAKHCNTYIYIHARSSRIARAAAQINTATHCNALQHTAAHCCTLQHTAAHCNTLPTHCNTLPTHCNTLQHTATHCNILQHTLVAAAQVA